MSPAIEIKSRIADYAVRFHDDLSKLVAGLAAIDGSILIVDKRVSGLYPILINGRNFKCYIEIDASEENKTLGKCEDILKFIAEHGANKGTQLIGIGGGIIQDLVTFCAHVYFRGLDWIYVPTTLLGMADSCIGAKASINFLGYKNQLGVFHSPRSICICTEFLRTLPKSEICSGYGEIVKLHLIQGLIVAKPLFSRIVSDGFDRLDHLPAIKTSLEIKKAVIEVDEFDRGLRKTLNYGHTFGHALESITSHQVPHGIAVAWGMDLINFISHRTRRIPEGQFKEIHDFLSEIFAWEISTALSVDALIEATRRDKKSENGSLRLVMPTHDGKLELVPQEYTPELRSFVSDYLLNYSILKQARTIS